MQVKGVIFDMDGLMFDTERISVLAHDHVARELGIDLRSGMPDVMGMSSVEIRRIWTERFGPDFDYDRVRAVKAQFHDAYLAAHGLPVKAGLPELIADLRQRGLSWAMATSTRRSVAEHYLELAGLRADFPLMVCGDMVERSKPDPQIFYIAAELLDTTPGETLVLEDSFNGIRAAAAGGFLACMVPDLRQPDQEIAALLTRTFDTLLDVIPFLDELQQTNSAGYDAAVLSRECKEEF